MRLIKFENAFCRSGLGSWCARMLTHLPTLSRGGGLTWRWTSRSKEGPFFPPRALSRGWLRWCARRIVEWSENFESARGVLAGGAPASSAIRLS